MSMADSPRIVIAGWAGAGNTGDELLTSWAVSVVKAAGGEPVVLSVDPADTARRHGVESVRALSPAAARTILGADGLVVGPGGILQDSTSIWSLPAHCTRPLMARLRRIPIVGAALGVGPITRRGSSTLLRFALGSAKRVVVRDPVSAAILLRSKVVAQCGPDAMFAAAPDLIDENSVARDRIIVSLRKTEIAGTIKRNRSNEVAPDMAAWSDSLVGLRRHLGVPIRFVSFDPGRDHEVHRQLAEMIGECELLEVDNLSAPAEVARSIVAVTGRYHAAVLAAAYARPVVALDQGSKLPALVAQIGPGATLLDPVVTAESLCDAADESMSASSGLVGAAKRLGDDAAAHGEAIREMVEALC